MLTLPDVTLCTVTTVSHELHMMAADECLKHVKFGDVKIFSDEDCGRDYVTKIPKFLDFKEYERFFHYDMLSQIRTTHLLVFQWDSWIINPSAWRNDFLSYDYIGAPWWYQDEYNVGNSGFCLRSKRLMDFIASHEEEFPVRHPEDHVLCRVYQKYLPQFKWASDKLAWYFAFECTNSYPLNNVFGFHNARNWPLVLEPKALRERMKLAEKDPHITSKSEWPEMRVHV